MLGRSSRRTITGRSGNPSDWCIETSTVPWRGYRPSMVFGDSETGKIDKIDGPYYFFSLIKRMRDYLPGWLPSVPAPARTAPNWAGCPAR